jgi:predicted amidophosphoribosyltransferase
MSKLSNTFAKVNLDALYYLDFYSIERFGKTRLGQLLLYAKQSQDKSLMKELIKDIKPAIDKLIKNKKIDSIGFVPPTVKRKIQFMKQLEKNLHLNLPIIPIIKIKTPVIIPQKTLNKLEDRVENAKSTFIVTPVAGSQNILLIDDAVGSGATINEIAGQMRHKKDRVNKIIGLTITGSFKGFDVISEI